jgi:hypothetical protein
LEIYASILKGLNKWTKGPSINEKLIAERRLVDSRPMILNGHLVVEAHEEDPCSFLPISTNCFSLVGHLGSNPEPVCDTENSEKFLGMERREGQPPSS